MTPNGTLLDRSVLGPMAIRDDFKQSFWTAWDLPAQATPVGWIANTPWGGNFGSCAYAQPGDGSDCVRFNDPEHGGLKLTLKQHGDTWIGGLLSSVDRNGKGFARPDGYWEIIAKLPSGGQGPWFAFWLNSYLGQGFDKYVGTELDAIEWYAAWPDGFHMSYHLWAGSEDIFPQFNRDTTIMVQPPDLLMTRFNRYGILVDDDWVRVYLNDSQVRIHPRSEYSKFPMCVLIDLVAGGADGRNEPLAGSGPFDAYVTAFNYYPLRS
jgi:hypothetical protein